MKLENFLHVIRAAAAITGETVFVVVGSQAVLAQFPHAPEALLLSQELDLYPKFRPDLADLIEGSIGADSMFHGAFGYHADGVAPETAKLPPDWETRALRVQNEATGNAVAICPEIHDLIVAKLVAGRDKDIDWITTAVGAGLAEAKKVEALLDSVAVDVAVLGLAKARLHRLTKLKAKSVTGGRDGSDAN